MDREVPATPALAVSTPGASTGVGVLGNRTRIVRPRAVFAALSYDSSVLADASHNLPDRNHTAFSHEHLVDDPRYPGFDVESSDGGIPEEELLHGRWVDAGDVLLCGTQSFIEVGIDDGCLVEEQPLDLAGELALGREVHRGDELF